MIALDTNVVLRMILADDAAQNAVVKRELDKASRDGIDILVNDIVLAETVWTLVRTYRIDKRTLIAAVLAFRETTGIRFEDDANLGRALELFEHSAAGFADCLTVAKNTALGCTSTLTFDQGMRKLPGVKLLPTP